MKDNISRINLLENLKLKNKIFLAPMEEINDVAFRILCKKAGCGLTYTGMIHPQSKQEFYLDDKPALQLFCTETKAIKEFMKKYDSKVTLWDFNLGCPAKTARKHGFGVFLHSNLEVIEDILKTMRQNTKKPLIVKLRKSKYTMKILKIANKYCDAICIHPRTQPQGYSGIPDLELARKIKKQTKLPIIYSGNVDEENYNEFLKEFDYVMIGRKAIGNPNIFSKLSKKETNFDFNDYLELSKKYKLPFRQIKFQAMNFTKGKEGATDLRLQLAKSKNIKQVKEIMKKISE
jgi:tRNA-dihydrouridine synthase B